MDHSAAIPSPGLRSSAPVSPEGPKARPSDLACEQPASRSGRGGRPLPPSRPRRGGRLAGEARRPGGLTLSPIALQELPESPWRADKAELLGALPSLPIERTSILEALAEGRAER